MAQFKNLLVTGSSSFGQNVHCLGNNKAFKIGNANYSVGLHMGSGGHNRGLYDFTKGEWMIFSNELNSVYMNGTAAMADEAEKVLHNLATQTPFYLSGTTLSSDGQATPMFDPGIYTDGTAGHLIASGGINTTNFVASGNLTANGNTILGTNATNTLIVKATSTFNSALTAKSGATVEAGGLTVTAGGLTVSANGITVGSGGITVNDGGLIVNKGAVNLKDSVTLGDAATDSIIINGATELKDTLTVTKATTLNDILTVAKAATFNNNLTVKGATVLGDDTGDTVTIKGPATLEHNLIVKGTTTLGDASGDTVTINGVTTLVNGATVTKGGLTVTAGGLTVSAGGAAITGNSTITGTLTSTKKLTVSSEGIVVSAGGASIKGATSVDGTFSVTGTSTFSGNIAANGGVTGNLTGMAARAQYLATYTNSSKASSHGDNRKLVAYWETDADNSQWIRLASDQSQSSYGTRVDHALEADNALHAAKASTDTDGNVFSSYYCTLSTDQTISAKKTFSQPIGITTAVNLQWNETDECVELVFN